MLNTESGTKVLTSVARDKGEGTPLAPEEPVLDHQEYLALTAPTPLSRIEAVITSPVRDGAEDTSGWHNEVEDALRHSSILPEHRSLLGMTYKQFWSAEVGIAESFISLSKGFEVC